MTKYICIEPHSSGFKVGEIYNIVRFLLKEEGFEDYVEIYDSGRYIGSWWIDLDKYFTPLAEWRDKQIDNILND
jgi:hypothetical protein